MKSLCSVRIFPHALMMHLFFDEEFLLSLFKNFLKYHKAAIIEF